MSKKALLIGINYTGTNIELTGCINDITNISKVLEKFKYSCTCLTDLTPLKPTKNKEEFTKLVKMQLSQFKKLK